MADARKRRIGRIEQIQKEEQDFKNRMLPIANGNKMFISCVQKPVYQTRARSVIGSTNKSSQKHRPARLSLPPLTNRCFNNSNTALKKQSSFEREKPPEIHQESNPYEFLREQSKEMKDLITTLDRSLTIEDEPSPSDIPGRTPEPEFLFEFPEFRKGEKNVTPCKKSSSYQPRYCWCTRCQIMYRMYKENDRGLESWGNYPCFRF